MGAADRYRHRVRGDRRGPRGTRVDARTTRVEERRRYHGLGGGTPFATWSRPRPEGEPPPQNNWMRQWITFLLVFSLGPTLLFALIGGIARSTTLSIVAVLLVGIVADHWLRRRAPPPDDGDDGDE